jgi:hypothetical protein
MSDVAKIIINEHWFLDEAGDTTFYGKGKTNALGQNGVSQCFILGMAHFNEPLNEIRKKVIKLQHTIVNDPYFNVPSVKKKVDGNGYYFHATDDLPEIKKLFFDFIKTVDCKFEAVVGTKSIEQYETRHKGKEEYLYADLLSHLLKGKLKRENKLVLNVAHRGKSTRNHNLDLALEKAKERYAKDLTAESLRNTTVRFKEIYSRFDIETNVAFNVNNHTNEPLLNIADYLCWSVQRVFEKGETRFYDFVKDKIELVVDLYDFANYEGLKNYYTPNNPLTAANKKSPP